MFQNGDDDFITCLNICHAVAVSYEVQRFGGVARENDFAGFFGVDEFGGSAARLFVGIGCFHAERVKTAQRIGILCGAVVVDGIYDGLRLLRGCGIVEINDGIVFIIQYGKILA